jgi:hypothetical protein
LQVSGHGEKRSRQAEAAISALLAYPTIEAAAEQAGIGVATLRRWLAEDDFQRRYREARRQIVEQAISGLQQATGEAVETLRRNLTCGVPASEIAAAKAIIDQSLKGIELLDLAADVAELKRQLSAPSDADAGEPSA